MSGWFPVAVKRPWLSPVPTSSTFTERVVVSDHPPQDTRLISHRLRIYAPHHRVKIEISKCTQTWYSIFVTNLGQIIRSDPTVRRSVPNVSLYRTCVGLAGVFHIFRYKLGWADKGTPHASTYTVDISPSFPFSRVAWRNQYLFRLTQTKWFPRRENHVWIRKSVEDHDDRKAVE